MLKVACGWGEGLYSIHRFYHFAKLNGNIENVGFQFSIWVTNGFSVWLTQHLCLNNSIADATFVIKTKIKIICYSDFEKKEKR